ncbi:MAG: hypothetical protein NZ874_08685 [Fimbriimonadales bacterium]|nr:hypothetical protein [Fimbriimonadales bacterium]
MDWLLAFLPLNFERTSIWIGAICTLAIYSILYRENPFYRLFEHMFVGLAAGYALGPNLVDVIYRFWWEPIRQDGIWWLSFVVPFGMYLYFIYNEKYGWVSRIVIGALIGASAGLAFQAFSSRYLPQLQGALSKVLWYPPNSTGEIYISTILNNWIFVVILLAVLTYFTFSFEHRGAVKRTATLGRWLLMIGLGAIFGNTVMARMALLIGRVYYLLDSWLMVRIGGG